jgi:hypothetical protein
MSPISPSAPVAASTSNRLEIAIGWSLAACLHPMAAWRVLSTPRRYLLAGAYGMIAYVVLLTALVFLS